VFDVAAYHVRADGLRMHPSDTDITLDLQHAVRIFRIMSRYPESAHPGFASNEWGFSREFEPLAAEITGRGVQ